MDEQRILSCNGNYHELDEYLSEINAKCVFLVCGKSVEKLKIKIYFDELKFRSGISVIYFSDFAPNPSYESVVKGIRLFKREKCDVIIAVGGGSAMDVAKCVKLYNTMNISDNLLRQAIIPNDVKLVAVPTTAGTGSEATRFAVIYYEGEKQSITHSSCIPSVVMFDVSALDTLPDYQRKVTMLDAFCHAIESYWSVNSTKESRILSQKAIRLVMENKDLYLSNDQKGNFNMLMAANIAGKAINITQTTAGHAMCYKLTSLYGIAHGHAAALCVAVLWPYMLAHVEKCVDPRGEEYLHDIFTELANAMGSDRAENAVILFKEFVASLDLKLDASISDNNIDMLIKSVNPVRLKNNPIRLEVDAIKKLYCQILYDSKQ